MADGQVGPSGTCNYKGLEEGVCAGSMIVEGSDAGDAGGSIRDGGQGVCQRPDSYESEESNCEDDLDNDCDGVVNEGCPCNALNRTKGVCSEGTISDQDGNCEPPSDYERDETSCDGKDNDCDGTIDEGCPCEYLGDDEGVCGQATLDDTGTCVEPDDYTRDETDQFCDAKDNDCDGDVDEKCSCSPPGSTDTCYTGPSGTEGVGICETGTRTCQQDGTFGSCQNEVTPQADEACNGKDDDCDGVVDEGCSCDYQGRTTGVCDGGGTINNKGNCQPPSDYSSSETSCDGLDNDCDGVTDERCPCAYNGNPDGVCGGSKIDPNSGNCQEPNSYEQDETSCDAKDNDCDGTVDEGCSCQDGTTESCYTGPSGTAGTGVCESGTRTCTNGSFGSCQNETTPSDESCDGKDNDCDSIVDEGCQCDYNNTSTGVCSNGKINNNGNCTAPGDYESNETSCDSLDNDCDGVTDERCPCNYRGSSDGVCTNSTIDPSSGQCQEPADYESDETSCDGKDNDCDGTVDEGCSCQDGETESCYTGPSGTAGTGVCESGTRKCTNGSFGDCQSETTPSDETCDGKDNDCDGTVDEGCSCNYRSTSDGVCSNQTITSSGSCSEPNDYENPEETCDDTKDNDCDGDTDCADADCDGRACGTGSGATCQSRTCQETACTDDKDNDLDGNVDCQDQECSCPQGTTCSGGDCIESACRNGQDDDNDGNVDCQDSDCPGCPSGSTCNSNGECVEVDCEDGQDNDNDGQTDCEDADCDNDKCGGGGPATRYCCPNPSTDCTTACRP